MYSSDDELQHFVCSANITADMDGHDWLFICWYYFTFFG